MSLLEADPNLELYHSNFKRPTKTLRQIYALTKDEKLKTVLDMIFRDRKVSPIEEQIPTETPTEEQIKAYKEKRNAKLERYEELADKNKQKAQAEYEYGNKLADMIPMGQPILIGHHSEGKHRRHLEKIHNSMNKTIELKEKSEYYENKVDNILNPRGISSDDPEAIIKLNAEIAELEKTRTYLKTNYVFKSNVKDWEEGSEHYRKLELESVTRKIRDKKKRIEQLRALNKIPSEDKTINGITLSIDKADNRVKLFFPSIPSEETRTKLKSSGFHWSPTNQAWQRMISNQAIYEAEQILNEVKV